MPDEPRPVDILEAQITALSDTHKGLAGLIQKVVRMQSDLLAVGFQEFSDAVGEPFAILSPQKSCMRSFTGWRSRESHPEWRVMRTLPR